MATSGSFNTTAYGSYGRYVNFSWSIKSQSTANNSTVISWTLKGAGGDSTTNYYNSGPFELTINGEVEYSSSTRIELRNGTTIATGETTIKHNADGTKTFAASCKAAIYSGSYNVSGSGSWTLTQIPRAATLTAAPSGFYDTDSPTITYSNPAGNAVDKLEACITNSSGGGIVGYRNISKTGTSYTFNLTAAEKTALYKACSTSNNMAIRFYIRTTIGSNYYYSYLDKRFAIKDPEPIITTYTAENVHAQSIALAGNNQTVISGYNQFNFYVEAQPQKESTIVSYRIWGVGFDINSNNSSISGITTGTIHYEAVDSRGNSTLEVLNLPICGYFTPTLALGSTSINTDGTMSVAVSGRFYNNSFGATRNALTLQYRLRENSGNWGSWTTVSTNNSENSYSATISKTGLNYQSNYDIEVKAADKLQSKTVTKQLQAIPVFEWGKDTFQVNADYVKGNVYGLGKLELIPENANLNDPKYREPGVYGVSGNVIANTITNIPIKQAGRLIVYSALGSGWDGSGTWNYINQEYHPLEGKEPIYKRVINTTYTANEWYYNPWTRDRGYELLWSGAESMGSGHRVDLNNLISNQPNGIMLRFCYWDGTTPTYENVHEFFVPKDFATRYAGKSHTFMMCKSRFIDMATKHVYIKESGSSAFISGYVYNTESGTNSGITFNNNAFCLFEVIGV